MCCHGNINTPILLKFVKIYVEMTSQWRHYCFGGLDLPNVPLQESVSMATAKDLHSNFYLLTKCYIFSGKVTKFVWIIFPLSDLWEKNLKGVAEHPRQDKVNMVDKNQNKLEKFKRFVKWTKMLIFDLTKILFPNISSWCTVWLLWLSSVRVFL